MEYYVKKLPVYVSTSTITFLNRFFFKSPTRYLLQELDWIGFQFCSIIHICTLKNLIVPAKNVAFTKNISISKIKIFKCEKYRSGHLQGSILTVFCKIMDNIFLNTFRHINIKKKYYTKSY